MYFSTRKTRASVRRTICLIVISCISCIVLVETILEFDIIIENSLRPIHNVGLILNRSQILLSKEILLQPSLFPCLSKRNSSIKYPIIIIVKTRAVSSGDYYQRRIFTRLSWGQEARSLGIPVIYTIGRAKDEQIQKQLEYENKIYNDILQFNYIDTYSNLSIKTIGIFNWFIKCGYNKTSQYLFIVDDDILINIPSLLNMISKNSFQLNTLYSLHLKNIQSHSNRKWLVNIEDHSNEPYPGISTLYPSLIIDKIHQELFSMIDQNKSISFLDDILISDITAEKLNIQRALLYGIEDCSYTDLFSRVVISECNNIRRRYVWLKFILSRKGENTLEIDRLIQTKTTYTKWYLDFKQISNSTSIILTNPINILNNSIFISIKSSYLKFLFMIIFVIIFIFIF